ncbi:glutamate 5-kinase [Acinetobacter larvae]|uniref:Glutamate 5-kinase n=1 Tax=Acinetobacter larvae TaxID=1789224 RepID=A0A1B2LZL0_9GAMM|nr:glutamate 5-kinase [Acinetobacter larvae]AOA58213.1 glutamate 5-kinase [Acinetobacter larvae]
MGLRDEIQADIAEAFSDDLADAVHQFTCIKIIYSGDFDFATQTYEHQEDASYTGRGVLFGSYQRDLVKPTDYEVTDSKATVLQNEVTAVPQINDVWETAKGQFKVIDIGADPVGVTWKVQLRKVS